MKKDCSNCSRERFSIPCYDCLIGNNGSPSRWLDGENYVPETVALRAKQQIERRSKSQDTPAVQALLRRIGVSRELYWQWGKNNGGVSSYYLQQMALDGYDVVYILTGENKGG